MRVGVSDHIGNDNSTINGAGDTIVVAAPDTPARTCRLYVPPSDIDACVRFSLTRMLMSIGSLLLALTDIPRTGLGLSSLKDYFNVVELDTVMYFGPYAYPVAHFVDDSSENNDLADAFDANSTFTATAAGGVDVWPYKFDSLSIPTRALALHLNVTAYPPCLLSSQSCDANGLSVRTAFTMLDALVTAVTTSSESSPSRLVLVTTSLWIDRLHQFLVQPIRANAERRTHIVQHYAASSPQLVSSICDIQANKRTRTIQPLICDTPLRWVCDHPATPASPSSSSVWRVPIGDHIALRVAALQQQYPRLVLDLTLITSRLVEQTQRWQYLPAVSITSDSIEVTTLIRGRSCRTLQHSRARTVCRTVFVDDYRYERATFISDADQWSDIAGGLRAAGQGFIWLRFLLLVAGCYKARICERKFVRARLATKLAATARTLAKIPSHVVVYGSWCPIVCYVLAHYLDSALIHLISNAVWSSINGVVQFEPIKYVRVASIQMRNIWLVALLTKAGVHARQCVAQSRQRRFTVRDGVVGVRAALFGVVSSLTVFSCLRARRFRDVSILEIIELAANTPAVRERLALSSRTGGAMINASPFGIPFDLLTLAGATCIVVSVGVPLALVGMTVLAHHSNSTDVSLALTCRSHYVPHSADGFWPRGALLTHWRMTLVDAVVRDVRTRSALSATNGSAVVTSDAGSCNNDASRHSLDKRTSTASPEASSVKQPRCFRSAVAPAPRRSLSRLSRLLATRSCHANCASKRSHWGRWWHDVQGCPRHDSLVDVAQRTARHWSAVRILNIAMMTDPLVLAQLYAVGLPMLIYRAKLSSAVIPTVTALQASTQASAWVSSSASSDRVAPQTLDTAALSPDTIRNSSSSSATTTTTMTRETLYVCPAYVMGDTQDTVRDAPSSYFRDYELVGTTDSSLLPWTVLVSSG